MIILHSEVKMGNFVSVFAANNGTVCQRQSYQALVCSMGYLPVLFMQFVLGRCLLSTTVLGKLEMVLGAVKK